MDREFDMQDWQNRADVRNQMNANDVLGIGLQNQRWQQGQGYGMNNANYRLRVAGAGEQHAQNQYGNARADQAMANQNWQLANQNYGNLYQQEAADAGWGTKMLIGGGMAALNVATGGMSGLAQGVLGGGGQGGNAMNQYQNQQPGWLTPGFNPFGVN